MIKPLGKVRRFPNGIFWTRQARLKECYPFYGRITVTLITTIESQLLQQEPGFIYQCSLNLTSTLAQTKAQYILT